MTNLFDCERLKDKEERGVIPKELFEYKKFAENPNKYLSRDRFEKIIYFIRSTEYFKANFLNESTLKDSFLRIFYALNRDNVPGISEMSLDKFSGGYLGGSETAMSYISKAFDLGRTFGYLKITTTVDYCGSVTVYSCYSKFADLPEYNQLVIVLLLLSRYSSVRSIIMSDQTKKTNDDLVFLKRGAGEEYFNLSNIPWIYLKFADINISRNDRYIGCTRVFAQECTIRVDSLQKYKEGLIEKIAEERERLLKII
jgi:hypothetical protein